MKSISLKLLNDGTKLWLTDKNHNIWKCIKGKIINYNYINNNPYNQADKPVYSENGNIYWISYNNVNNDN